MNVVSRRFSDQCRLYRIEFRAIVEAVDRQARKALAARLELLVSCVATVRAETTRNTKDNHAVE